MTSMIFWFDYIFRLRGSFNTLKKGEEGIYE